jgi:site-specific DNA-adenine methylase
MHYIGSKLRLAKEIMDIIIKLKNPEYKIWVEPFVGGNNFIFYANNHFDKMICSDINEDVILMHRAFQDGSLIPIKDPITKEEYENYRKSNEHSALRGYWGIMASFRGKWFGSYHIKTVYHLENTKNKILRQYYNDHYRGLVKELEKIKEVNKKTEYITGSYEYVKDYKNCVIYMDIPYKNTLAYSNKQFDHEKFWSFVKELAKNNDVFVSEITAPDEDCFKIVWSKNIKNTLCMKRKISDNGDHDGFHKSPNRVEKLYQVIVN